MSRLTDGIVGAMAQDIAKSGNSQIAVRLLREATSVESEFRDAYQGYLEGLVLVLPLDFMDLLDDEATKAIAQAAKRVGQRCDFVAERLAPAAPGWRESLAELEDWGATVDLGDEWPVINERVHELKGLFQRAITPDDRSDVGRRCRELMIAAASATYRPVMLPEGSEAPKESDAKTKAKLIVDYLGSGSVDKRLSKLIDKAWDLAVGLSHHSEPAHVATYGAAQATILVVRTLAMVEGQLQEASQ